MWLRTERSGSRRAVDARLADGGKLQVAWDSETRAGRSCSLGVGTEAINPVPLRNYKK